MPNLGVPELALIALVLILLFGWKKLPDAARSIGRSMRIFKSEVKEMRNDDTADEAQRQLEQAPPSAQANQPQQAQPQPNNPAQQ